MAKLVLAMFTSLDGYIEGSAGLVPPPWSAQVADAWSGHNLANAAHLLYGRVNFAFNKGFWTSPQAAGRPETDSMKLVAAKVLDVGSVILHYRRASKSARA